MDKTVYFAAILFISVAYGRKYCCVPDQWEGIEELMIGTTSGSIIYGHANISFDLQEDALYAKECLHVNGKQMDVTILMLYKKRVQYNIMDGKCTRIKVPKRWSTPYHCIPDDAILVRNFTLGGKALSVSEYAMTVPKAKLSAHVTVANKGCIPVTAQIYGSTRGVHSMMFVTLGNVTPGITDSSVFKVPKLCKHAPEVTDSQTLLYRRRRGILFN